MKAQGQSAKDRLTRARAALVLEFPFYGTLALRLRPVEDPEQPTAWTDGLSLGYNPSFIESLAQDEIKGLLCHEVMHCANAHHTRRGKRDAEKWNIAADYSINNILDALTDGRGKRRVALPKGALIEHDLDGQAAEEIYSRLPQKQFSGQSNFGEVRDFPGGAGDEKNSAQGKTNNNKLQDDAAGAGQRKESAAENARNWKIAVAQAAQAAKRAGKLPAELDRYINELLEPVLPWRDILRRFITDTAKSDYTWTRPNRHYIAQGFYFPSCYSESMRPLVIAIDTSGSIDDKLLQEFAAELRGIVEDLRPSVHVIYCDSRVQAVQEFGPDDALQLKPKGGGGTDFRPVFKYIEKHALEPACIIYFTDLCCNDYPEHCAAPVLWVTSEKHYTAPPLGDVLEISRGQS